jgi:hypothetical protein
MKAIEAVRAMCGNYRGAWETFGLDGNGAVVKTGGWTDVVEAGEPTERPDRAFVKVKSVMSFEGGGGYTAEFTEGHFVLADGSPGDHFFDVNGQVSIERPMGEDCWVFEAPIAPYDHRSLGVDATTLVGGRHVTVKCRTRDGGREHEWISRVTTLSVRRGERVETYQFVSMKGRHEREAART